MAHFFIPIYWLYILTAYIRVYKSFFFFFFCKHFDVVTWSGCLFSCNLWSLYLVVHFLSMWLRGIIAITSSNDDSASPWKIPLWIFTKVKFFPHRIFRISFSSTDSGFGHITLISMVKFESLAQFPMYHHSHSIFPSLVLVLCQFVTFAYVIDRFISVVT